MNVTEVEHAYIGNLALDVHHDSTPYNVAPAVRDKPPQASHDEKDEGIPLTRSGISKKRKEASVEIMGKGGRRRKGHKPTDQLLHRLQELLLMFMLNHRLHPNLQRLHPNLQRLHPMMRYL
nr:uncharacterized protein LOC125422203 [Ziziphus jujuba var. spinosa]